MVDFDVNLRLNANSAQTQLNKFERGLKDVERQSKGASRTIEQMEANIKDLTAKMRGVDVGSKEFKDLSREVGNAERKLNQLSGAAKKTGQGLNLAQAAATGFVTALSTAAINVATKAIQGLGAAAVGSVRTFAGFESSMNNVAALSGAVGSEFEGLKKKAKELGASTRYSASEVADSMGFLAMAGFETNDILDSTQDMLNLAAAGQLDLARAADIASNVMGQFGIHAKDAGRVTNLLAATAASANTNVSQLSEAMVYLGPTAEALGISVEETAGIIGVLGESGIQGSMAGRALGSSLVRLTKPVGDVAKVMSELGLQVEDSNGSLVSFEELLRQLERGLEGYTDTQKTATISTLFGTDAFQEINILLKKGSEAYAEYTDRITGTNKAQEIAEIQGRGLEGAWRTLLSVTEGLSITLGEALAPAVQEVIEKLSGAALNFIESEKAQKLAERAAGSLTTALGGVSDAVGEIDFEQLIEFLGNSVVAMGNLVATASKLAQGAIKLQSALAGLSPGLRVLMAVNEHMGFFDTEAERLAKDKARLEAASGRYNPYATTGPLPGGRQIGAFEETTVDAPGRIGSSLAMQAALGVVGAGNLPVPPTSTSSLLGNPGLSMSSRNGSSNSLRSSSGSSGAVTIKPQAVYIEGGIGPRGPNQYGDHLDIARVDKGYFDRTALDQFVRVNGAPLSQGLTVRRGRFGAPRDYNGDGVANERHRAWDFGYTPGGGRDVMELVNGAYWTSNRKTAYGDSAAFKLPSGEEYRVIHGRFEAPSGFEFGPATGRQRSTEATPSAPKLTSIGEALIEAANALQVAPQELVSLFSFETGGTLNPAIRGGKNNNHVGLYQAGIPEQAYALRALGLPSSANFQDLTFEQQVQAFVPWALSRDFEPGKHGQQHLYAAILNGTASPKNQSWNARDENQTSVNNAPIGPGTPHWEKAGKFLAKQNYFEGQSDYLESFIRQEDLAREAAAKLAAEMGQYQDGLDQELKRITDSTEERRFRNELIQKEIELIAASTSSNESAIDVITVQEEATRAIAQQQEKLNQALIEGLIDTEGVDQAIVSYTAAIEDQAAALTTEIELLEKREATLERQQKLERYNQEAKATAVAFERDLLLLQEKTAASEREFNQSLLTGFGSRETQRELALGDAQAETDRWYNEQFQALSELQDTMAPEKYGQELDALSEKYFALSEAREADIHATYKWAEATENHLAILNRQQEVVNLLTGEFTQFATNVISGAESMGSAIEGLLNSLLGYLAQQAFTSLFGGLFGGLFGTPSVVASANGNVLAGGFTPFASGGVVTKPTLGLIGEAGQNEAVVPLPDGRSIPVKMANQSTSPTIVINVTNNTSNPEDGRRLSRQIAEVVKAELINQRRTGGILS